MTQAGFTMTPPAEHPFGTGNSLVQLNGFFLEFLHLPNPHLVSEPGKDEFGFAAFNREFMQDGAQGCSMLVFEADDASAEQARFEAAGLQTYQPFGFSRLARQPDGEEVTVGFSLAFTTHKDMPRAAFFYCQQHSPEYFWKAEYQRHANTAVGINEVALVAQDPLHYQEFLALVANGDVVTSQDDHVRVRTPRGDVTIYRPELFEAEYGYGAPSLSNGPVIAGYRIDVENREVARNYLDDTQIAWRETPSGHAIGPDDAAGTVMAFAEVM